MHKIERRECLILAFPVQRRLIAELPAGTTCICDSQAMPKCGERMSKCSAPKSPLNTKYSYGDHLVGCDSPTPPMLRRPKRASKRPGCRIKSKARSTSN